MCIKQAELAVYDKSKQKLSELALLREGAPTHAAASMAAGFAAALVGPPVDLVKGSEHTTLHYITLCTYSYCFIEKHALRQSTASISLQFILLHIQVHAYSGMLQADAVLLQ
jgi:hypothetical protein